MREDALKGCSSFCWEYLEKYLGILLFKHSGDGAVRLSDIQYLELGLSRLVRSIDKHQWLK